MSELCRPGFRAKRWQAFDSLTTAITTFMKITQLETNKKYIVYAEKLKLWFMGEKPEGEKRPVIVMAAQRRPTFSDRKLSGTYELKNSGEKCYKHMKIIFKSHYSSLDAIYTRAEQPIVAPRLIERPFTLALLNVAANVGFCARHLHAIALPNGRTTPSKRCQWHSASAESP